MLPELPRLISIYFYFWKSDPAPSWGPITNRFHAVVLES